MSQITLGENETIESALRRFKREVSKAGIFLDMKKHRHFETQSKNVSAKKLLNLSSTKESSVID
jgi:small subunit ribosomal protein S21